MEGPDPLCLFSALLERRGDTYVFEVPAREVDVGALEPGEGYRVGVYPQLAGSAGAAEAAPDQPESSRSNPSRSAPAAREAAAPQPPVSEGERRVVTIESVGKEGDGIAKVDRGYVLVVPGTEPGQEVEVEVSTVTPTVGFADVVDE